MKDEKSVKSRILQDDPSVNFAVAATKKSMNKLVVMIYG